MLRSKSSLPPPHPVSYKESKAKDPEIRGHSMYLRGEHRVRCLELWSLELFCLVYEHHLIQTGKCLHSVAVKDQVMPDFILWDRFCFIQNCYFSNLKSSLKACMCVQLDMYVSWWACGGQKTTLNVGLHRPPIETRSPIIGCYVHQAHWSMNFWGSGSAFHLPLCTQELHMCTVVSGFTWVLWVQIQVLPHLQGKCLTHWVISSTPRFQILVFLMSYFIYLLFIQLLLDNQYINVLFIKNGYCKSVGYLFLVLASIICLQKPHKFKTLNFGLKCSTIFWHSSDFFWNNRVYN